MDEKFLAQFFLHVNLTVVASVSKQFRMSLTSSQVEKYCPPENYHVAQSHLMTKSTYPKKRRNLHDIFLLLDQLVTITQPLLSISVLATFIKIIQAYLCYYSMMIYNRADTA
jgi:hypothetical protein